MTINDSIIKIQQINNINDHTIIFFKFDDQNVIQNYQNIVNIEVHLPIEKENL